MKLVHYLESLNFNSPYYSDYMGGAVAAIRALTKGDSVGVITARSNASGNEELLRTIEDQLSLELKKVVTLDRSHVHFVNDAEYVRKSGTQNLTTYAKKAAVILGYVLDTNSPYSKLKFYDDDSRNLEAVRSEVQKKKEEYTNSYVEYLKKLRSASESERQELKKQLKFLSDVLKRFKSVTLKVYDVTQYNNTKLKESGNNPKLRSDKKVLHLFDVDDTLLVLPSSVRVKSGGKLVRKLSTSELKSYVPSENEELDFTEFSDNTELQKALRKLKSTKDNVFKK